MLLRDAPVLDAHLAPQRRRARDVARGPDPGEARHREVARDAHAAVVAHREALDGGGGAHADGHDGQLGLDPGSILEANAAQRTVALEGGEAGFGVKNDALALVLGHDGAADARPHDLGEGACIPHHHVDLDAALGEAECGLEADEAPAHEHGATHVAGGPSNGRDQIMRIGGDMSFCRVRPSILLALTICCQVWRPRARRRRLSCTMFWVFPKSS